MLADRPAARKGPVTKRRRKSTDNILVATDYASLMECLRQRSRNLKLTYLDLEVDADLPDGYCRKIFDLHNHMTPPTFSRLLKALEAQLVVQPLPRVANDWRSPSPLALPEAMDKKNRWRIWGSQGGRKRALKLSPKRRREIAAIGAYERWRVRRETAPQAPPDEE